MIRLNDIVVKFGDFTALHGVNAHVKEGEFFTFLGPSGCGKTTTLRTITGFIEPVRGSVVVKDRDITHVPIEDRNIGIVFQSYALFPTMTVYDNIAFGLKVKKAKKSEIDGKVREIARKVDLSDEQLKKAVSQLSGGQQQRVAIARALVTGPAIICMDEPLSNLDAKLRVQLRNELKKCRRISALPPSTLPTIRRRRLRFPTASQCSTRASLSRSVRPTRSITTRKLNLSVISSAISTA